MKYRPPPAPPRGRRPLCSARHLAGEGRPAAAAFPPSPRLAATKGCAAARPANDAVTVALVLAEQPVATPAAQTPPRASMTKTSFRSSAIAAAGEASPGAQNAIDAAPGCRMRNANAILGGLPVHANADVSSSCSRATAASYVSFAATTSSPAPDAARESCDPGGFQPFCSRGNPARSNPDGGVQPWGVFAPANSESSASVRALFTRQLGAVF